MLRQPGHHSVIGMAQVASLECQSVDTLTSVRVATSLRDP